jgi:hypothetical protein
VAATAAVETPIVRVKGALASKAVVQHGLGPQLRRSLYRGDLITETALVSDIDTAKSILTTLQSVGIKVCLDDFGTGYSSLYHLRELRFDKVKIDRSFVQSMRDIPESEKIVDAILALRRILICPPWRKASRIRRSSCAWPLRDASLARVSTSGRP